MSEDPYGNRLRIYDTNELQVKKEVAPPEITDPEVTLPEEIKPEKPKPEETKPEKPETNKIPNTGKTGTLSSIFGSILGAIGIYVSKKKR